MSGPVFVGRTGSTAGKPSEGVLLFGFSFEVHLCNIILQGGKIDVREALGPATERHGEAYIARFQRVPYTRLLSLLRLGFKVHTNAQ